MDYLLILLGVAIGIFVHKIYIEYVKSVHGYIIIDHSTNECIVKLCSDEMLKRTKDQAILYINHDGDFSREEHDL